MRSYRIQRQKRRPCIGNDFIVAAERGEACSLPGGPPGPNTTTTNAGLEVPSRRGHSPSRSSTGEESTVEKPDWKPSVYWVMLCLFVMSVAVICASGALFQHMEAWTFTESVYFSFVSYATIGFGDFVSLQGPNYGRFETLYRFVAYVLMVFGCCCIYSLLNVTSIVIKQFLNYIIKRMDYCGECCCCMYCRCSAAKVRRRISTRRRSRRRGIPRKLRHIKSCQAHAGGRCTSDRCQIAVLKQSNTARALALGHHPYDPYPGSPDANSDGDNGERFNGSRFDLDERRCSGENMISIRGELSNKVSLAVMQKRLYETAQMSRHSYDYPGTFSASSVGPLAIVTEKLGDNPA
jgi:potassium channel subfamily K protein 13